MAQFIEPLPYVYDKDNARIVAFLNQVKGNCDDEDGVVVELKDKPEQLWPIIWRALRRITTINCWDDAPEDLFVLQGRTQIYDTTVKCGCSPNCCDCDENYVIIPLEYAPYPVSVDSPFVSGRITAMIDGKFVATSIDVEYLNSHLNKSTNELYISRTDFSDFLMDGSHCCCLCERNVSVELQYNAGYAEIPAGLLPVLCAIIKKEAGSSDDCHDNMTETSGLLKRKKVGNVEYEWSTKDTSKANTSAILADFYDLGLVDEVLAISRCYLATQSSEIGDVV